MASAWISIVSTPYSRLYSWPIVFHGQLALLADRHEAAAELMGDRAAEDEAARLDAGDIVDAGREKRPDQPVDRGAQAGRIGDQRGDVAEEDPRLRDSRGSSGSIDLMSGGRRPFFRTCHVARRLPTTPRESPEVPEGTQFPHRPRPDAGRQACAARSCGVPALAAPATSVSRWSPTKTASPATHPSLLKRAGRSRGPASACLRLARRELHRNAPQHPGQRLSPSALLSGRS